MTTRASRLADQLARPWGWAVLGAVAVALLALGSVHPALPSAQQRIAELESVIKCPSCADLSIAQSNDPVAAAVRAEVVRLVGAGASDAAVERRVVAQFGSTVLLVPPGHGIDAALWVLPVVALASGAGGIALVLLRRRRASPPPAASAEDEALVAALRREAQAGS